MGRDFTIMKKLGDLPKIDQKIIKLWDEGHSASAIGDHVGMTRNAVMGRIHRARCNGVKVGRSRKIRTGGAEKPERKVKNRRIIRLAKKENKPLPPLPPLVQTKTRPIPFMKLAPDSCRFIVNDDPAKALFCGAPKETRSYCKKHALLCYIPKGRTKWPIELLALAGITRTDGLDAKS